VKNFFFCGNEKIVPSRLVSEAILALQELKFMQKVDQLNKKWANFYISLDAKMVSEILFFAKKVRNFWSIFAKKSKSAKTPYFGCFCTFFSKI